MLLKILLDCWNVCGLGMRRKRDDVRAAIETALPSILCLQEPNLYVITPFLASSFLPQSIRSLVFKPSVGTSGAIAMLGMTDGCNFFTIPLTISRSLRPSPGALTTSPLPLQTFMCLVSTPQNKNSCPPCSNLCYFVRSCGVHMGDLISSELLAINPMISSILARPTF
jgi:hypothetical protein